MGRLGNNFYRIGYLCPDCGEKLHMVVYPIGAEFKIETPDGAVLFSEGMYLRALQQLFYTETGEDVERRGYLPAGF